MVLFSLQLRQVFLCFDDYGYRALCYRNLLGEAAVPFSLKNLLLFLQSHYLHWGGRVLYFFFGILLMQDVRVFRMAETVVMTVYVYLAGIVMAAGPGSPAGNHKDGWRAGNRLQRPLAQLLVLTLLCLLGRALAADGVYWYTAACLYVFPAPVFLLHLLSWGKKEESSAGGFELLWAFAAACSQEQYAMAVLAADLVLAVRTYRKERRLSRRQKQLLLASCAGAFILFVSPGNLIRAREMAVSQRNSVVKRAALLVRILGGEDQSGLQAYLLGAAGLACLSGHAGLKTDKKDWKQKSRLAGRTAAGTGLITIACAMLVRREGLLQVVIAAGSRVHPLTDKQALLLAGMVLFLSAVVFAGYFGRQETAEGGALFAGAITTLFAALLSDQIPIRTLLPYDLLMIPVMGCVLWESGKEKLCRRNGERFRSYGLRYGLAVTATAFLVFGAAQNAGSIYRGYLKNAPAERANIAALNSAFETAKLQQEKQATREGQLCVVLLRHADDAYGNMMPYMQGYEWIETYIRKNYHLPEGTRFYWK